MTTTATTLSYSLKTGAAATGLSQAHLAAAIARGDLRARRSSTNDDGDPVGKWVILTADLEAYLASLPEG